MQILTERFEQALVYAARLHNKQLRKGTNVPYITHLLSAAALVLEDGGDEDQAIAALLHDAVEDQGGLQTLEEIRVRFGERVALIVDGCSDAYGAPKPPWKERKEKYLERIHLLPEDVHRVSLADKLHNARSVLASLAIDGISTWDRFQGGHDGTLWYYQQLVAIYRELGDGFMVREFERVVNEIIAVSRELDRGAEPF